MHIDRVRSSYNMRPVRPFTIHTASGERYSVKHPEAMAIDEEDGIILLLPGPGQLAMIDLASITEIEENL